MTAVTAATGGSMGTGGTTASGGTRASGGGGAVGTPGMAGDGGRAPSPMGPGGVGGAGGVATSGGAAGVGGAAGACTRDLLKATVAGYFTALAAHTAATLPLAADVKFTENGKAAIVGQGSLWKTAGAVKFTISAYDADGCNTATEAVVPDGTMDIPFALRLRLRNQQITEIETIAVRPGDYQVSGSSFASHPGAIITSDSSVHWEQSVPVAQRNSVQDLTAWMTKYFAVFPNGVCNTASSCKRLENGGGSFSCSAGASCSSGSGSGAPVLPSHAIFGDVETGIGAGFDDFMGNCDMHIFKMSGGLVYAVHAILGACNSTGWN